MINISQKEKLQRIVSFRLSEASRKQFTSIGDVNATMKEIMDCIESNESFSKRITKRGEDPPGTQQFHEIEGVDEKPLKKSAAEIFKFMTRNCAGGKQYYTTDEIRDATGVHLVTVTNRIRDFRTPEWGAHQTPKRRRGDTRTWEYTLIPNKESLNYKAHA